MKIYVVVCEGYNGGVAGAFSDYATADRMADANNERDGWGDWAVHSVTLDEWLDD